MSQAGTINLIQTAPAVPTSFTTDSGTAVPISNNLEMLGINNIATTGSGKTVTIKIDGVIDEANGGTGESTYTDGQLLIGNSSGNGLTKSTLTDTAFIEATNGNGSISLAPSAAFEETGMHGWNGSILETTDVNVTSNGTIITLSVEKNGGGNQTVVFSDGYHDWDTSPADTIVLTEGTDEVGVQNFVFFLQSTKALTANTTGFPSAEHAPIATVICQSAASLQTDGCMKCHVWTDHLIQPTDQGHVGDISSWIRMHHSLWISGVVQTFTITTNGGSADNVILTTTSGVVLQLHNHNFPAFTGTPDIYVVNDSVSPFTKVTDLNALLTDSTGASMSGKFFSLVIWGVVSEDEADCKLFCNLPGGSYNTSAGVTADASKFANFDTPNDYAGTSFLIAQWNLRHQTSASGTWSSVDEIDLRGLQPSITPGGTSAFPNEFIDSVFRILDDGDNTKEIAFQASGITAATTRTLTVPDASGTIAYASGLAAQGFAFALDGNTVDSTAAATNGQLLIGSTSAVPVASSITSTDGSLTITAGAGTLVIEGTAATDSQVGVVELATDAETNTGTSTVLAITPANITAWTGDTALVTVGTIATGVWNGTDIAVPDGGTGAGTLTDGGVLLGSGVGAITALGQATNGQLVVGSTGADPILTSITSTDGSLTITAGAGTLVIEGTAASAIQAGVIELATDAETNTGTATDRAITPANITAWTGDTALVTVGTIATGTWEGTDVTVANGGTGVSSTTAFAVLCGGTTSTAALQPIASVGTAAQVLTSNGAGALPTFQAAAGGGGGGWAFVSTATPSGATEVDFIDSTASGYKIVVQNATSSTDRGNMDLRVTNDGSTFATVDYQWRSVVSTASSTIFGDTSDSSIEFGEDAANNVNPGNATGEFGMSGEIIIYNCNTASEPAFVTAFFSWMNASGGDITQCTVSGVTADDEDGGSTDDVDGFRLRFGTTFSGTIHFYKLVTS